jgi:hypothetical protein
MEYIFLDDFNPNNFSRIKDKKNVMVIYGQRITELRNELNRSKETEAYKCEPTFAAGEGKRC